MTSSGRAVLDPILSMRVGLLEQALEEVKRISEAMKEQRQRLDEVEQRLKPGGLLSGPEMDLIEALAEAEQKLNVVLRPDRDWHPVVEAMSGPVEGLSEDIAKRLWAALTAISIDARDAYEKLYQGRRSAYSSFEDVRRWSIAGLAGRELAVATGEYGRLLREIRESPTPWRRYQQELHGRGKKLFTGYLELLGRMAVRGLEPDAIRRAGDHALVELLWPRDVPEHPASQPRSPFLMGTQHLLLGYPEWNLWTLPLDGRPIAEKLIDNGTFTTTIPSRLRALCADVYLLHVLGPSYAFAAIFIGLDPYPPRGTRLPDLVRAGVLIDRMAQLHESEPHRQSLARLAAQLEEPWSQARDAFGGTTTALAPREQQVIDAFFAELRTDRTYAAYDASRLSDAETLSNQLVVGGQAPDAQRPSLRNLLTAMWLARLQHPDQTVKIHKAASDLYRRPSDRNRGA